MATNGAATHSSPYTQSASRRTNVTAAQLYPDYVKKRKKKHALKRVGIAFACILLACIIAVGAYAFWFASQLDSTLALDPETKDSIEGALEETDLNHPFYILLLGSDQRENAELAEGTSYEGGNERSDVIMLARIDTQNQKVTLVSIPRDTPYTLEEGTTRKINQTYTEGGAAYTIRAVSEVTGVPISHYAEVHISDLESIVDYLGGVEVTVDIDMTVRDTLTGEKITLQAGKQTLNGQQAQAFARGRKMYSENQDGHRQSNVRSLLEAIVRKALSKPVNELPDTILNLAQCANTDLKTSDLATLALAFAKNSGNFTMYGVTGPIDGDTYGIDGEWLCYPNPEGWAKIMAAVGAGEDPSDIDVSDTTEVVTTE